MSLCPSISWTWRISAPWRSISVAVACRRRWQAPFLSMPDLSTHLVTMPVTLWGFIRWPTSVRNNASPEDSVASRGCRCCTELTTLLAMTDHLNRKPLTRALLLTTQCVFQTKLPPPLKPTDNLI